MKFAVSFSGGKDSMLAMHKMITDGHVCEVIFTTTNKDIGSWFHDIDVDILKSIADSSNVEFIQADIEIEKYDEMFEENLRFIKDKYLVDGIVFGDIDIIDHYNWCQQRCDNVGLKAVFPLWNEDRVKIVEEFIELGYKAIIKRVDKNKLPKNILKRQLDRDLLIEFEEYGIDLCGENGEYHTLVYGGPLFNNDINLQIKSVTETENTYVLDVSLATKRGD